MEEGDCRSISEEEDCSPGGLTSRDAAPCGCPCYTAQRQQLRGEWCQYRTQYAMVMLGTGDNGIFLVNAQTCQRMRCTGHCENLGRPRGGPWVSQVEIQKRCVARSRTAPFVGLGLSLLTSLPSTGAWRRCSDTAAPVSTVSIPRSAAVQKHRVENSRNKSSVFNWAPC